VYHILLFEIFVRHLFCFVISGPILSIFLSPVSIPSSPLNIYPKAISLNVKGEKCIGRKKSGKPSDQHIRNLQLSKMALRVIQLDLEGNYITEWISAMEIKRNLGFDNSTINKCCKNIYHKTNKAYGYKWKYKEEYLKL